MGAKDSKRSCLLYEDAVKRVSDVELKRVCEAFKRLTGGAPLLSRQAFIQNVLGDGVPSEIAEWLYTACGGGPRGIALRDLICGLVLLTKGSEEEKIKFLWTLYCNDSGTHITRVDFQRALETEGTLPPNSPNNSWHSTVTSLFGNGQDRIAFDHFRAWLQYNKEATVLSKWLLTTSCVTLSSEMETPTFYQTLAGVTHLEEQDICELEKCFWSLQANSGTGQLDLQCLTSLVSPPIPAAACQGLFLALDVNRDGHVDFKELCCGISAACRGPTAERMKFCFKIFDLDRDGRLNAQELHHMLDTLLFIVGENEGNEKCVDHKAVVEDLKKRLTEDGALSQEEFLMWTIEENSLVSALLELLLQVCHVSLGLKPFCRHQEHDIVTGWLKREEARGYRVGQFWFLISSDWWQSWMNYTTSPRSSYDNCICRPPPPVEEGIVCDESFTSNGTDSNEFTSNSTESMGDLLSRGDSCSIASSSGVSSSSGTVGTKRSQGIPGPIENGNLVAELTVKVPTLTGEGGRLKRDTTLVQHRDFELVPDSLWKALALWYGGPLPLPRQVIRATGSNDVELELYPLNLRILRHQMQPSGPASTWSSVVGGYSAAALSTAGITSTPIASPRRALTHTAAFSRLANVRQVGEFLCLRLGLKVEDVRLWHVKETPALLEDENATLQELGVSDNDQILLEVRNKDLTWPEELGALVAAGQCANATLSGERRPTICLPPGATGLHNLGNTCFMNAALQAVSNTRPLTQYFQHVQLCELNSANPLGTKGLVARRYAELCRELWAGSTRSVVPLKLRWCVTKHAPHFGGGGQHDSQELLAWLLDTLHEDLNRVSSKRYSETKDSGGRPDTVVAEEAWLQHLARDHSIITDLFYGQLKSKVTCQTCGHESVKFDPFNLLSLPLPMESYTLCEVLVIRLNGEVPVKYGLRLNSESKYSDLKEHLQELCGIPHERLLLAEVAYSQIRQMLPDDARINAATVTDVYAYELPPDGGEETVVPETESENERPSSQSPLARSPEVRGSTALCMPNILCFKTARSGSISEATASFARSTAKRPVVIQAAPPTEPIIKPPTYFVAVHRKCVRQETYFLSQHKSRPSLFGVPLLLGCNESTTCQGLYEAVWGQVTRLLSPLPQCDQTNHATDCDDSLGYEFPFVLKAVLHGGQICALCHWTRFCRGCTIPCAEDRVFEWCGGGRSYMCVAIDWDPTALHLRYQSGREKLWTEHGSMQTCRRQHTEPIDLDYCLKAFTSEERLETWYHCSNCQEKQPATKKLQIWRLPPLLIVHLKRFDCVSNKWVKTQKAVNFPFRDFDPTAYLASVPQETILRHRHLTNLGTTEECFEEDEEKLVDVGDGKEQMRRNIKRARERLESTSLTKTPINDEDLKDYHQHKLLKGQDPFDLKYQLYAVVSHSGLLNGGHYISYASNPNGNWYCYNDSSCREVMTEPQSEDNNNEHKETEDDEEKTSVAFRVPKIDASSAYILFYERSGLDYQPYFPEVVENGERAIVAETELEESEEMRRQLCSVM